MGWEKLGVHAHARYDELATVERARLQAERGRGLDDAELEYALRCAVVTLLRELASDPRYRKCASTLLHIAQQTALSMTAADIHELEGRQGEHR